jgi:V/A-type H+-transporting ATPase subunit D
MDRKRNILIREMVSLSDKSKKMRGIIEEAFSNAYNALQTSHIMLGSDTSAISQTPLDESLHLSSRSVMGVEIPTVTLNPNVDALKKPQYTIHSTDSHFDYAYMLFGRAKRLAADLAEIENSIYRLALAIKKTQKRANALENVLIPMYERQVKFITGALEEKEREEFSRQKVIKSVKLKKEKQRA